MKHQSDKHDNQLQYNKIKANHEHNVIIVKYMSLSC